MARGKTLTLDEILQPGMSFSVFFCEGNRANERIHIRAIIDDDIVIYRTWQNKYKQRWCYYTGHRDKFKALFAYGDIIRRIRRDTTFPECRYDIMLEGNNGGDVIRMNDLGDGLVKLESGHCCVYDLDKIVPVEFLTTAIYEMLMKNGSVEGVLRNSGWSDDFVEGLLEKMNKANQKERKTR